MNYINVHLIDYDANNHSILVSFSSDKFQYNTGEEKIMSYDLATWPDKSIDDILLEIAKTGLNEMHREIVKLNKDEDLISSIKNKIGTQTSYHINDINPFYTISADMGIHPNDKDLPAEQTDYKVF